MTQRHTQLGRGCLLVASPQLRDPNFHKTVVLVVAHDAEGSFGLVLNRPTDHRLGDLLPDVGERAAKIRVACGGPVQPDRLQLLSGVSSFGETMLPGVGIGGPLEELDEIDSERVRAYLGYAGWGGGQLEEETGEGSWIVAPASAEHVFEVPAEQLWAHVLRSLGGRYAWLALEGGEPEIN